MKHKWPEINTFRRGNTIKLVQSGNEYFDTLERLIKNATRYIHLQSYIIELDDTGKRIMEALIEARKRGVEIYMVVDAFGSNKLTDEDVASIKAAGINFRRFSPVQPLKGIKVGRRMHHKIYVADDRVALLGGINLSNKYCGKQGRAPWLDFAVLIKGPLCHDIEKICKDIWDKKLSIRRPPRKASGVKPSKGNALVRLRQNDWVRNRRGIVHSYYVAFRKAEKSILIVASYFLPSNRLRFLIQRAVERGVKVTVVLSDVSDVPIAKRATNYLYAWMLRQNIDIYEYKPAVVHGKVAIVDGYWCTVGSYNLNYLSEFGSIETNLDILDEKFCVDFESKIISIINKDCRKVTLKDYVTKKSIGGQMLDWGSYQLVRASMRILYVFTRKDIKNILE